MIEVPAVLQTKAGLAALDVAERQVNPALARAFDAGRSVVDLEVLTPKEPTDPEAAPARSALEAYLRLDRAFEDELTGDGQTRHSTSGHRHDRARAENE